MNSVVTYILQTNICCVSITPCTVMACSVTIVCVFVSLNRCIAGQKASAPNGTLVWRPHSFCRFPISIPSENDISLTKSLLHLMFMTSSRLSPDLTIVCSIVLLALINTHFPATSTLTRHPLSTGRH